MHAHTSTLLLLHTASIAFALPSSGQLIKRAAAGPWFDDFADPGIVFAGDSKFYAYATNSGGKHVPVATADSIGGPWEYVTDANGDEVDAMPTVPAWYTPGCDWTWAPDVVQVGDSYNMLFAGPSNTAMADAPDEACKNYFCIGLATSSNPAGPFEPAPDPLICRDGEAVIDGSHFTDVDGRTYYLFSGAAALYIQEHDAANPTSLINETTLIWSASNANDAANVSEAPYLVLDGSTPGDGSPYYLFYSTGTFSQADYTVTYATSPFILGPYTEQGDLLATGAPAGLDRSLTGPGGATLVPGPEEHTWFMAFHALSAVDGPRPLYTAQVDIQEGAPRVQ